MKNIKDGDCFRKSKSNIAWSFSKMISAGIFFFPKGLYKYKL